jgi:AcrR family transcriptional regulator
MSMSRMSAPRRQPVQQRSTETVDQILSATSALLGRTGVGELTTSRIAAEAGLSVGALYRFFPDKQAILDAIAVRHMETFRSAMAAALARSALSAGPVFLGRLIDAYVRYLDEHADFRALALGGWIGPLARESQARPGAGPAALLKWFMRRKLKVRDSRTLDLRLRVAIETGERLIAYAYEHADGEERTRVITELKHMLASYLFVER